MRKSLRASYTVEAAILMPVVLILVGVMMEKGIVMYQETSAEFRGKEHICQTEPVKTIRRLRMADDVLEELGWN